MATSAPQQQAIPGNSSLHALQFRVMRLCKPSLSVETPMRFALDDLGHPTGESEDQVPAAVAASLAPGGGPPQTFEKRLDLLNAEHASGITGMLVLPQSFGTIYLGETFTSYISVGNHAERAVQQVGIKDGEVLCFEAELQTERQRLVLFDNTAAPIPVLQPGSSHDFTVEHDLKELGAHTLVCSTVYTDAEGERRYLPQYFKFSASNPLAVRTKVRPGREGSTLLEACIENATRAPLLLSSAKFEPSAHLGCTALTPPVASGAGVVFPSNAPGGGGGGGFGGGGGGGGVGWGSPDASGGGVGLPSLAGRALHVLAPSGGSTHYLFELRAKGQGGGGDGAAGAGVSGDGGVPLEGGNTLGKLEICWKGHMGEAGRLQTQQILGAPRTRKDVELSLVPSAPTSATLAEPLVLECVVRNRTQKKTPALELVIHPPPPAAAAAAAGGAAGAGGGGGKAGIAAGSGSAAGAAAAGGGGGGAGVEHTPGVLVDGPQRVSLGEVPAGGEARASIACIPLLPGVQRLPHISVQEDPRFPEGRGARVLDQLKELAVLVER